MNLNQFRAIAPTLDKEIGDVFQKFGLKVGKRGATVDPTTGTISFRLTLIDTNLKDASGNTTTPDAERYKQQACFVGLDPAWLNREIKYGNRVYKIVGLKAGRSSKPVLVEIDGKKGQYILSVAEARKMRGLPAEMSLAELRTAATGGVQ